MMYLQQNQQNWAGALAVTCLFVLMFSSCGKDRYGSGYQSYPNGSAYNGPVAYLSVIDASPDAGSLDFYLDKNQANNYPITFANGLAYINAYTGKRQAAFYQRGTTTVVKKDSIT